MVKYSANVDCLLGAVADKTRYDIMSRLVAEHSLKAGDIARRYDMSLPAVSKHLRILRQVKLVRVSRRGRERVYTPNIETLKTLQDFIRHSELFWKENLDALADYVELKNPNM